MELHVIIHFQNANPKNKIDQNNIIVNKMMYNATKPALFRMHFFLKNGGIKVQITKTDR